MSKQFDAVIIGSGIGGLTCGAFLARAGMKVAVLERHYTIGGYAHSFRRGDYRFESGIHSVSLAPDGFIHHLLRLLGVESEIEAIAHEAMYSYTIGDRSYRIPVHTEAIIDQLRSDFPAQSGNIDRLFSEMRRFYESLITPLFHFEERFIDKDRDFIARYFNRSYTDHLQSFLTDRKLVEIFSCQWPFWGMPPEKSPTIYPFLAFYVHALEGSHHIKGGFSRLADALALAIRRHGGTVRTGVEVSALSVDNGVVRAVTTADGEQIEADVFVSNISPFKLHREMVPEQARSKMWLRRLRNLVPSVSAVGVYCGLHRPVSFPGGSGLDFWFSEGDCTGIYESAVGGGPQTPRRLVFLHSSQPGEKPTMLVLYFVNGNSSGDWKNDKMRYAEQMIEKTSRLIPGFREAIDYFEVASPATFERFSGNTLGALYGFENTKEVYGEARIPSATYIRNLFQAGHWCKPGGGVWNVMECGYTTAHLILNGGQFDS